MIIDDLQTPTDGPLEVSRWGGDKVQNKGLPVRSWQRVIDTGLFQDEKLPNTLSPNALKSQLLSQYVSERFSHLLDSVWRLVHGYLPVQVDVRRGCWEPRVVIGI